MGSSEKADAILSVFSEISPSPEETTINSMGFDHKLIQIKDAMHLFSLLLDNGNSDAETRLDFILYIKSGLNRILGSESIDAQQQWMRNPNMLLASKSPTDTISTRDINDLAMVASLIDKALSG